MKKSLILVGMLAIGYANAQEGNVGINTENPKATLDIQPSATNLVGTTNEGILAPRLSKERIANITETNLVEGTLVYATDTSYTGANVKVAKITEKGYYFYNGTEWVRVHYANIYTENGTLAGDRTVDMANNSLHFESNNPNKNFVVKNNSWFPLIINTTNKSNNGPVQGGGIAIHPDNFEKRIEMSVTQDGDMRLWASQDNIYVKRETGNVGIYNANPTERLDVAGKIKSRELAGTGDRIVYADENGVLKVGGAASSVSNEVKPTSTTAECTDANAGTIHYVEKEITGTNKKKGIFGFCSKNVNGDAVWVYLNAGSNLTNGTGTFGEGL